MWQYLPHDVAFITDEEPDIDNSVCKTKKQLLHLRNKETAVHEDGHHPTKTYHP
jgi:hypothetical protein